MNLQEHFFKTMRTHLVEMGFEDTHLSDIRIPESFTLDPEQLTEQRNPGKMGFSYKGKDALLDTEALEDLESFHGRDIFDKRMALTIALSISDQLE